MFVRVMVEVEVREPTVRFVAVKFSLKAFVVVEFVIIAFSILARLKLDAPETERDSDERPVAPTEVPEIDPPVILGFEINVLYRLSIL